MPLRLRCVCGEPAEGYFYPAGEGFVQWHDAETTLEAVRCGQCGRDWWLFTNSETRMTRLESRSLENRVRPREAEVPVFA